MARKKPNKSSVCGFCNTGDHNSCIGTKQRWVIEPKGRKKIATVVWLDEYIECSCPKKHFKPVPVRPVEDVELP